jgi:hypothetical protein
MSTRTVKVKKADLIAQIKLNKEKHIAEYNQAVIDYRDEANKQLTKLRKALNAGKTDLRLEMTEPVNKEKEYDKLIKQFEWEQDDLINLSQPEFDKYIHDEHQFSLEARLSNLRYSKLTGRI